MAELAKAFTCKKGDVSQVHEQSCKIW